jgi:hypothetical protein
MKARAATSMGRFVEANMKASALVSAAPLVNRLRVAERAANEHDDEAKPRTMATPNWRGDPSPRWRAACRREMKTWMTEETA